jgi:microsomal dipeptidase-like Zn-dependent dipeptidase
MKEGMGWLFRGKFNGPLMSDSWKTRFSSQINPESLEASGLDIVVAALYAHPLFTLSLKDSIRRQIEQAQTFVKDHPEWVIATTPEDAKKSISEGKRVMILALEGADGILDSEEDLKEFIDRLGIRIVAPLHLTDDSLGGVAFLRGYRVLSSPIAFVKSLFQPVHDSLGVKLNPDGLSEKGKKLVEALISRKVWIDLAHSSDSAQRAIIPLMEKAHQPLLYTHTVLRKYHRAERAIQEDQLKQVAQTRGYIGLMPSPEMLDGTPDFSESCTGGVSQLATQFKEVAEVVGESAVSLGSDYNGGIPHLTPGCPTGTSIDQQGLWNIGQSHEIWKALAHLGVTHASESSESRVDRFLNTWSQLWTPANP